MCFLMVIWLSTANVESILESYIFIAFDINQTDLGYLNISSILGCIIASFLIKPLFSRYPNYKLFITIGVFSFAFFKSS